MANFALIVFCLVLGATLRRTRLFPADAQATLNAFVLTISVPAVALSSLHGITLERSLFFPIAMAWIVFGAAAIFFEIIGKMAGWRRQTIGALTLTAGLGNTSFVGYPMLLALFGPEALKTGVLTDQTGSFLVLSSLGVITAALSSEKKLSLAGLPAKLLRFPPFVAMILALVLRGWTYPPILEELLQKLSATLAPLALTSIGMQMGRGISHLKKNAKPLALGLSYKLLFAPALIFGLYVGVFGARGQEIRITIIQAAMAPMVTGAILATDHGLEPDLANLMVTIGIPLSLVLIPLWNQILIYLI